MAVLSAPDTGGPPQGDLFQPDIEATREWDGYQDGLVREAVRASARVPEGRERLRLAGVAPGSVQTVADLPSIPILAKDQLPDLQGNAPPFGGMLGTPVASLRRIFQSPGPILDPEGDRPDFWRMAPALWAAGFRSGDIVQNTFAYHLTPAGAMLEEGLRAIGCVVVPGGVGGVEAQVDLMSRAGVTGFVGTPDFLLQLLQRARDRGVQLGVHRAFVTGAALPPALRREIEDTHGVTVFQGYGTADCGNLGYECAVKDGWHVAPGVVIEIVDPTSGKAAPKGEVVVTRPDDVYPMLRFGTGDLSALSAEACTCGRTTPRLVGFLGRAGAGVKVRGMFVHPRQLAAALAKVPAVGRYQARVGHAAHKDTLTLMVEPSGREPIDPASVELALREAIRLRVDVEILNPGALADSAAPLVDDRVAPAEP